MSSPVNISGNFTSREFTVALQLLKPDKALGFDSVFPELILHAGAAPKSWLCGCFSSTLKRLKISKIWRRALVVSIPNPKKTEEDLRAIAQHLCFVSAAIGVSNSRPSEPFNAARKTIITYPTNSLCNFSPAARSISKTKKIITSPTSPHRRLSSDTVDQKSIFYQRCLK